MHMQIWFCMLYCSCPFLSLALFISEIIDELGVGLGSCTSGTHLSFWGRINKDKSKSQSWKEKLCLCLALLFSRAISSVPSFSILLASRRFKRRSWRTLTHLFVSNVSSAVQNASLSLSLSRLSAFFDSYFYALSRFASFPHSPAVFSLVCSIHAPLPLYALCYQ